MTSSNVNTGIQVFFCFLKNRDMLLAPFQSAKHDAAESYLEKEFEKLHSVDIHEAGVARWKRYYSKFMLLWSIGAHTFLVLQIIQLVSSETSEGLSVPAFILYTMSAAIWFTYGTFVLNRNNPIMISSSLGFALGVTTVILIFHYKDTAPLSSKKGHHAETRTRQVHGPFGPGPV